MTEAAVQLHRASAELIAAHLTLCFDAVTDSAGATIALAKQRPRTRSEPEPKFHQYNASSIKQAASWLAAASDEGSNAWFTPGALFRDGRKVSVKLK